MRRSKCFGQVLGTTLLLWALCAPALHAETPAGAALVPALLQDLSFTSDSSQTKITIRANQAFDYTSYYPNPRLFILDIPGAQSQLERNFVDIKTAQVEFANVSQIGEGPRPMVRIEFNLVRAIQYSLKPDGSRLSVTFKSMNLASPEPAARNADAPPVSAKPVAAAKAVTQSRGVTLQEDDQHIELVLPTAGKTSFKHFELTGPSRLVIDVSDSVYNVSKQAVKLESDLIRRIRFGYGDSQEGKLVRCVFDLSRQAAYTVQASDAGVVIRFQKQSAAAGKPSLPKVPPSNRQEAQPVAYLAAVTAPAGGPEPLPVSSLATELQPLKGFLLSETRKFVMPVPQAAPRNLPLLEGNLNLAEIQPKDKLAGMPGLAGELKVAKPLPPIEPLPEPQAQLVRFEPEITATPQSVEWPAPPKIESELVPPEWAHTAPEAGTHAGAVTASEATEATPHVATVVPPAEAPAVAQSAPDVEPKTGAGAVAFAKAAEPEPVREIAALVQPGAVATQPTPAVPVAPAVPPAPSGAPAAASVPVQDAASQVISAAPVAQAPQYSGEPISLELKDADLKDFFRLIGEISGLNIVLDPDVKGTLTIFLNDVPWDQALDVVLKNNSLGKQLDGNVLRIASNSTLEAEEAQRKRLSDARVLAAELQTETRILSYAKAADLSLVLKKVLSPRGDIIVDTRTNAMIISDIPAKFPAIDALIKQLDKKIKQVEIEARVIAATRDFLRDVGVQIGAIYGNNDKNTLAGAVPGNPFSRTPPPNVTIQPGQSGGAQNALPLLSNLGANAPTSGLSFFAGIADNFLLDVIITAAERRGTAKLLSKPKIITQDNIEGFVQQGVKIPVQTTINNTVSVQFFDFSLKLTVTPQITDEGTIILKVDVENSTPDFSRQVQGVPTVNTQQTKTTVLALNGGTVVIGGVMIDSEQINIRQVPGFGAIPVIGNLFKNRAVTKQTQELIFFLSPKIL